jgi:hypothetical protein
VEGGGILPRLGLDRMFCGGAVIVVVVIAGGEWVVDESWKLVGFWEGAEVDC